MKVEQIVIDESRAINPQLKELALNEDVYILYNNYRMIYRLYSKTDSLNPDELKWENCWRMYPFKDYYYGRRDDPFFEETLLASLSRGTAALVMIS